MRKVEPLKAKLGELTAWATGIRRDQAPTRANAKKIEWDEKFGLVKMNPIADWTWENVWEYIRAHDVPYNPLHEQNYPSIGCTYCTRQVQPGEDPSRGTLVRLRIRKSADCTCWILEARGLRLEAGSDSANGDWIGV